jgi:hypothetical protein
MAPGAMNSNLLGAPAPALQQPVGPAEARQPGVDASSVIRVDGQR